MYIRIVNNKPMKQIFLSPQFSVSQIVHGQMRINDWHLSSQELLSQMKAITDMGIDTFDNADIYGNYTCEELVGNALSIQASFREQIKIITKCGINIMSDKFPEKKIQYYDYSYSYIMGQVEQSLKKLRTDRIDLLLLHRPSYLLDPVEVAKAFEKLLTDGKVRYFGVSNFYAHDFSMLQSYCSMPLITNQIEVSPYCLEHFENGNLSFLLEKRIKPMGYSPLAWGKLVHPDCEKSHRLVAELDTIARELGVDGIDKVIFAWIAQHPAGIVPINGSGNLDRIKRSIEALDIRLSTEQWQRVLVASRGVRLP